ncbi:hypothetical protein OC861_006961 [Tilletia horrida]|nr:hypothetical protein OC861_006961 [Tilletia horrida]
MSDASKQAVWLYSRARKDQQRRYTQLHRRRTTVYDALSLSPLAQVQAYEHLVSKADADSVLLGDLEFYIDAYLFLGAHVHTFYEHPGFRHLRMEALGLDQKEIYRIVSDLKDAIRTQQSLHYRGSECQRYEKDIKT